ncbi:hypothetical protein VTG60DRAFT_4458 [Thermothelomyces hinnuleus]
MGFLGPLPLLGALAGLGLRQDHPVYAPAWTLNTTSAVQVCSRPLDKLLYEHYHAPSVGPESLYRIASVSKVLGMHATPAVLKNRGASYFTAHCANDLTKLRRVILSSTLLRPATTRRNVQPVWAHRPPSPLLGAGHLPRYSLWASPFPPLPSPASPLALKLKLKLDNGSAGSLSGYQTLLSLSPEHGIGYAAFAVDGQGRVPFASIMATSPTLLLLHLSAIADPHCCTSAGHGCLSCHEERWVG